MDRHRYVLRALMSTQDSVYSDSILKRLDTGEQSAETVGHET